MNKIDYAAICPVELLEVANKHTDTLFIPSWYDNYFNYVKEYDVNKIIMDNGAYEQRSIQWNELLPFVDKYKDICDTLIVMLPDTIKNPILTINKVKDIKKQYGDDVKFLTILQHVDMYSFIKNNDNLDGIAIPIWMYRYNGYRSNILDILIDKYNINETDNYIHMLGLDSYYEVSLFNKYNINSFDTSMPFSISWKILGRDGRIPLPSLNDNKLTYDEFDYLNQTCNEMLLKLKGLYNDTNSID